MLPRLLLLLWVPVAIIGCLAFSGDNAEAEETLASWYGPGFSGLPTASGEPYDPFGFTAAHKTMPLGSELLVAYGGNAVEVTVNDRGPYVGERELDLSQGAAQVLGLTEVGVDYVEVAAVDQYAAVDAQTTQYASTVHYDSGSVSQSQVAIYDSQAATGLETATDQYAVAQVPVEELPVDYFDEGASVAVSASTSLDGLSNIDASSSVLVVRPGETLSGISQEMGVSLDHLITQNGISDPDFIYAGQVLYY